MKQIILNLVVGTLSFIGTSCGAEFENGVSDIDSWKPASYDFTINHLPFVVSFCGFCDLQYL